MNYKESAAVYADNCIDSLLDEWLCQDWGCSVQDFMEEYAKQFEKMAKQLSTELAQEEE